MILWTLFALLAALVLAFAAYMRWSPRVGGAPAGARQARIQASPSQVGGRFVNLVETPMDLPAGKMLQVLWRMLREGQGRRPVDAIPTVPFDRAAWERLPDTGYALAWFGHSSLLLKMDGVTFLLDPVFGERASTFSFIGPKRFRYTARMQADQLPRVDVVLLSHDHYDHLDHATIAQLTDRRFIAPLGVGAHLERWGVPASAITELDRWEQVQVGAVTLTLAPTRHFSGRKLGDRLRTLWGSWVIAGARQRVYFGADSGYSPTFREVGERFGPFDLALLECGAYNADWSLIHMFPEQTAQAALDVKAQRLMPIHWATFDLALHPWKEPIERLGVRAAELGLPLLTPRIGRIVQDGDPAASEPWWAGVR
ncbi:MAG: MBL fold metallo-hydrolase [Bacteroidetes bacterium]|nr:MBL fold metallo-hydrolase [Bacteroidota bacterium]